MRKLTRIAFCIFSILALAAAGCSGDDNGDPTCPADKDCSGMECGLDPVCGESCGDCGSGENCVSGQCEGPSCPDAKDCTGLECGEDPVCGESCGECGDDQKCLEGLCAALVCPEDKQCEGRECGIDPLCCESCGVCDPGQACGLDGQCAAWPPELDSLYAPCYGCIFPACDMQGDPGWDFATDAIYYKKDLHTIASTCPEVLQNLDERTRPGAHFYELDSLAMTGTCLYPNWPNHLGGGSAYDGIIGVCAYWEEEYFGFVFSIQYWATVDHTLDPPTGFGYVVLGNLPEDLIGVSECILDVDVTMRKCPLNKDC